MKQTEGRCNRSIRCLSENPPVTGHGKSAKEDGPDDPADGEIPDNVGLSTVHGHLVAAV